MTHSAAIETVVNALRDEPSINALFLSGSYGNGLNDEYSDIDFVLVADEGATSDIAELWQQAIRLTGDIVLWRHDNARPFLINCITHDWIRTDVVILKPSQMGEQRQDSLKVLFDPGNLYQTLSLETEVKPTSPSHLKYQFEEFIRILGLLHIAAGRQEYINGVSGTFLLRHLLVDLLKTEEQRGIEWPDQFESVTWEKLKETLGIEKPY